MKRRRPRRTKMNPVMCVSPIVLLALCCAPFVSQAALAGERQAPSFIVRPIGHVEKSGDRTQIVLDRKYQPGLRGMEGFSHVYVFWWFDKNDTPEKRAILQVHPRGNPQNPLTGVFATRSPVRPNLIALTLCRVVSAKENVLEVEKIDAFPGTAVLDIKPFIPGYDSVSDARVPDWLQK
jgi:tRNA-Thr(GGU) m(6)t(6)A37 methyltransferase TsaA